ncbi:bleomycin resistance protein [Xanthomonas hortorum pv. carotae str. M081]|nr:bleomycin resistance protein [Xanthomonas hortorum pv. carotae str. M081]
MCVAELPARGIPRLDPVGDKPWGMREFAIVDENGNLIRIGQVVGG